MLDKVLQSANFDPEKDVYITNSVFRMPPGTDGKPFRKPTDLEIDYYRPYVFDIIRLIDPRVILINGECGESVGAEKDRYHQPAWQMDGNGWALDHADLPPLIPAAESDQGSGLSKSADVGGYPRSPQEIR